MPPPQIFRKRCKKADFKWWIRAKFEKEQKLPDLVDPKRNQYWVKLRKWPKFPIFGHFFWNFLVFSPKWSTKISSFWQKSNLHWFISSFFLLKLPNMGNYDYYFHFTLYWWLFWINFLYFRKIWQPPILPKSSKKMDFKWRIMTKFFEKSANKMARFSGSNSMV